MSSRRQLETEFRNFHSQATLEDVDLVAVAPTSPLIQRPYQITQDDTRLDLPPPHYVEKHEEIPVLTRVKAKRFCCGCFETRRTCLSVWGMIILVFILALGIAGYLVIPRVPNITIGTPYQPANFTKPEFDRFPNGTLSSITVYAAVNFTVASQNFYDYFISDITVNGNLLDEKKSPLKNAYGIGTLYNVNIVANRVSNFTMPVKMYWNTTGSSFLLDPAIKILQDTTINVPRSLGNIKYDINVNLPIIRWTGRSLKQQGTYEFNIDKMTKDQRNMILRVVRQVLEGFLS